MPHLTHYEPQPGQQLGKLQLVIEVGGEGREGVEYRRHLLELAAELTLRAIEPESFGRDGIADTPARVARMWLEFIDYDAGRMDTTFPHEAVADQMVVVSGLRVWSICEHHLLPFYCDVAIGYIPFGKVLGLSKFARIAQHAAHRLQLQERLVSEIAEEVKRLTGSEHVAVYAKGEHLCMTMRGARTPHTMHSSATFGTFRDKPETRAEFFALASAPLR